MNQFDAYAVFIVEMVGEMFSTIDGAMLSACTAERDLQMAKITFDKALNMMVYEFIHGVQKSEYLSVLLQKINDGLIQTGKGFVRIVLTGIMGRTAVKDISASVAGIVYRNTALIREGVDRY